MSPAAPISGSSSATDEARDREQQTHLRVAEREVVADQRPRRPDRPVDELVEELDREQQDDRTAKAATPGGLAGCASHDGRMLLRRQAGERLADAVDVQHLDVGDLAADDVDGDLPRPVVPQLDLAAADEPALDRTFSVWKLPQYG